MRGEILLPIIQRSDIFALLGYFSSYGISFKQISRWNSQIRIQKGVRCVLSALKRMVVRVRESAWLSKSIDTCTGKLKFHLYKYLPGLHEEQNKKSFSFYEF